MIALNSNELLVSIKLSNYKSKCLQFLAVKTPQFGGVRSKIFGVDELSIGTFSELIMVMMNKDRSTDCSNVDLSNDNNIIYKLITSSITLLSWRYSTNLIHHHI